MRDLLFSRLAPLLLIKALPAIAIGAEDRRNASKHAASATSAALTALPATVGHEGYVTRKEEIEAERGRVGAGHGGDAEECLDGVHGEGVGGCLEEMYGLLIERSSRMYEYDQVRVFTRGPFGCHG